MHERRDGNAAHQCCKLFAGFTLDHIFVHIDRRCVHCMNTWTSPTIFVYILIGGSIGSWIGSCMVRVSKLRAQCLQLASAPQWPKMHRRYLFTADRILHIGRRV